MKFTIELTQEEADMIRYVLRDISSRRAEQTTGCSPEARKLAQQDAIAHRELADRIYFQTRL